MSIKLAFAAVLRALRVTKNLSQERLADALTAPYLSSLETGKATASLTKLQALSESFGVSPSTLIVLSQSVSQNVSTDEVLERVRAELAEFDEAGGSVQLSREIVGGVLVKRAAGKRVDEDKLSRIQECKTQGLSQSETARRLGLSTSTVHDLWKRTPSA
ncbi:helix-turn-helix domain-containing protein [Pseudomonas putida]|uniref:helix-turn-helix domain-containing protein n=1 Tax=Pseudomonas putida TaxID=303 RepID=UPI0039069526